MKHKWEYCESMHTIQKRSISTAIIAIAPSISTASDLATFR